MLIANGDFPGKKFVEVLQKKCKLTLCLDGAYDHCLKNNISIDLVLGDMDSVTESVTESIVLLEDQNKSDLDKGLDWIENNNYATVLLCGHHGGRKDHELMNIMIAYQHSKKIHISMVEANTYTEILPAGSYEINMKINELFSMIALQITEAIQLSGAKYTLDKASISSVSQGLSNIALKSKIKLSFKNNPLIFIRPHWTIDDL
ncbi:MAG: thiamine diphosphokinase [Candidatus Marinimicrobia bacterium]|nr:thiamine diphosphokinase [Candidatus Neomarinimicrobiota bacterium]